MMIELVRHRGAGSRDGYAIGYVTAQGAELLLIDEHGKPVVFSKKITYAANYNSSQPEAVECRKVLQAMHSTTWDD